jgi:tetratricopeptide (TPR) repeat protein
VLAALLIAFGAALVLVFALVARPAPAPEVEQLLARARDSYSQYDYRDNEAAGLLYERALRVEPGSARAMAGLSSVRVQRVIRWPRGERSAPGEGSALRLALASGRLEAPDSAAELDRALELARRAARRAPRDPDVLRALGLALSASGRLDQAAAVYDRILGLDPDDWGALINRSDIFDLKGEAGAALLMLTRAYSSMSRKYAAEPARVRPWQAAVGVEIARRYEARSDYPEAESWYLKTLEDAPGAPAAATGLRRLRSLRGTRSDALARRVGPRR